MQRIIPSALIVLACLFAATPAAQARPTHDTLGQYLSNLKKTPNDSALRERIIKHVQKMKHAPAIPAEAIKYEGAAEYVFNDAKSEADYLEAAKQYEKALLIAPWSAMDYFNSGVAYEKAGHYNNAITQFNFYLLAAPKAPDANAVRKKIGGLEYAAEKAARESSPEAIAEKNQRTYEEWLASLDGARYAGKSNLQGSMFENEFVIKGTTLVWKRRVLSYAPDAKPAVPLGKWYDMAEAGGQIQIVKNQAKRVIPGLDVVSDIFTISEDGHSLTQATQTLNGQTFTYYRQ